MSSALSFGAVIVARSPECSCPHSHDSAGAVRNPYAGGE
jgi:hypothetical protein